MPLPKLSPEKKKAIFRDLTSYSKSQVAVRHGFDKYYKNRNSQIMKVSQIINEVKNDPETFAVSQDLIDAVEHAMNERNATNQTTPTQNHMPDKADLALSDMDIKELTERASTKSLVLLNRKLDMLGKSKKELRGVSIDKLAKVMGIAFDKRQISKGEATQHVKHLAKVQHDLTPEQKLEIIYKMREAHINNESV